MTLLHGAGINVRYSNGTIIRLSEITYAKPPFYAKRIGNRVIGYTKALGGKLKEFTIEDIYNPQANAKEILTGGFPDAFDIKWGDNRAEKIYVAVSGPDVFQIRDPAGYILFQRSYEHFGLSSVYSVRLIDEDKILIGGTWDNETVLALFNPSNPDTVRNLTIAPELETGIGPQRNMQIGKIHGKTFAIIYIGQSNGDGGGLAAQEIDPENMEFVGEPLWIVKGLGVLYNSYLPLVIK